MRAILFSFALMGMPIYGQSFNAGTGTGGPYDAGVTSVDLSGAWAPAPHEENTGNPALVEYSGVPINDAARTWGLAWDPSRLTLPEHQCEVHVVSYILGGPNNLRIWEERDPQTQRVIAIKQYISTYEQTRTIWMDGRPHPSEIAAHTWMGFSTGKWEGGILTVYTTHMKKGDLRRNGLPVSDEATLVEHFIRNGNYLTHVSIVQDPVYLTEPFVRTQVFTLALAQGQSWLWPCESVVEIADRPAGAVPNYLPGKNPFIAEYANKHHLPVEAALGGAETMYPEYRKKLAEQPANSGNKP